MDPNDHVALHATFTARPGEAAAVADLIAAYADQVRAEPGNLVFEAARLRDAPDSFFVYEVYRDEAAFQAHLSAPQNATLNAALTPLITEPESQLTFLRLL